MGARAIEVVHRTDRLVLAHASPFFVNVWTAPPDLADIRVLEARQRDAIARGTCLNLAWLRPAAVTALPGAEVRAETRAVLDRLGPKIAANAQVVDASGFAGAAIRGFLTSVGVITGAPHPTRVCATLEEGLEWLARQPTADHALRGTASELAPRIRALLPPRG